MPKTSGAPLRSQVDCYLLGEGVAEQAQTEALRDYGTAVRAIWDRLAATAVGHWCMDNGVSEFRLAGRIRVNPQQAAFAVVHSVDDAAKGTVH